MWIFSRKSAISATLHAVGARAMPKMGLNGAETYMACVPDGSINGNVNMFFYYFQRTSFSHCNELETAGIKVQRLPQKGHIARDDIYDNS